jgi:cell division transport system ATP-binding protein
MEQISAKHLSFSFGSHWALKNISFSVDKGEFVFVTGPSGAGKTTLLRILHGALALQRGAAEIAGFDLKKLTPRLLPRLRRTVSVVFQDFKVLNNKTVFENVALPLEVKGMTGQQIARRVNAVLRGLNLEQKARLKCNVLSGGEQQRVAIARAVVVSPSILLADEPTGNLDEDLANRLLEIFKQFNLHGTTILLATHNKHILDTKPDSRIIALEDGTMAHDDKEGA